VRAPAGAPAADAPVVGHQQREEIQSFKPGGGAKLTSKGVGGQSRAKWPRAKAEIQTLLDKKVSKASIAKIMGISRTALYNLAQN
jgi:DNA invertase Pin-like site-specific DNA recombinase